MVSRRPRLSGIVCLRCEFRLLHTPARRQFPRFVASGVPRQNIRPRTPYASDARDLSASLVAPTRNHAQSVARYVHNGRASLGLPAEADRPLAEFDVIDENLSDTELHDELVDVPVDENISDAAAEQIWNSLLGEEGEPTEAEVFSYIDELRPTDETILPESDFQKRARTLAEGFTAAQLHAYIRRNRQPTTQPTVYPWEIRRRPWIPDVHGEDAAVDSKLKAIGPGSALLLKGYISSSMTSKERVIVQLMRECWGVSIRELMEAPGKLDVTVRELEFALLAAGAQTWLRDISTAFSTVTTTTATTSKSSSRSHSRSQTRNHRRIDLLPGRRKLRIFAPASAADAILAEINAMLQDATTKRFKLADVAQPNTTISKDALRAVGALTGSWVRLSTDEEEEQQQDGWIAKAHGEGPVEVLVSWVPPLNYDASLEDTGDVVLRLLMRTYGPTGHSRTATATTTTTTLDYQPLNKSKARFVADVDEGGSRDKLSWEHRMGKWARWIEPMPLDAATTSSRKTATEPSKLALPFDFTTPYSESDLDTKREKWYQSAQTSTVATIGRVLHTQPHNATGLVSSDAAQRLPDVERIFSPTTPPLVGMNLMEGDGTGRQASAEAAATTPSIVSSTTILLRFMADPKAALAQSAPPLEVYLDASSTGKPIFTSLHAIAATNVCDVLFPTQPVDARITQKRFYALPGADYLVTATEAAEATEATEARGALHAPTGIEPLLDFLEQSQLQPDGNGALATPLRLPKLGLPRDVLLPAGLPATAEIQDAATISYVFAGLEVRRRVATAFEGWTLALTRVEAGCGDGHWTELSLEAVPASPTLPASDKPSAAGDHAKESFRRAVGQLVHGDKVRWLLRVGEIVC